MEWLTPPPSSTRNSPKLPFQAVSCISNQNSVSAFFLTDSAKSLTIANIVTCCNSIFRSINALTGMNDYEMFILKRFVPSTANVLIC